MTAKGVALEFDNAAFTRGPSAPELSEDALALTFTARHEHDVRYVAKWGQWLKWTGTHWEDDQVLAMFHEARTICREAAQSILKDPRFAQKLSTANTHAAVERIARNDPRTAGRVEQWNSDQWILNTPTGEVDLRTGVIRSNEREHYITKITGAAPGGDCPTWHSFLERVTDGNRELEEFLQRMCGYALTGSTREEALFFLYGTGANGKSKFINTIAGVLGTYARTAPAETFLATNGDHHPTDVAGLHGARLVSAIETEDGRRWAESKVKALTGGDPIAARFMRQDFFEFIPQFKLIIAGNHKPSLRSTSEAIRRRFHLVPFNITIPAGERDQDLGDKLRAESNGILAWAIQGCLAWQREGLNPPAIVREATDNYMASEDHILQWIQDRCDISQPTLLAQSDKLYADYRAWCERANEKRILSSREFSPELERRGFVKEKKTVSNVFWGIALREQIGGMEGAGG
jgi:putative DNA primase/helicase